MKIPDSIDTLKSIWQSSTVNWRDSIALINAPTLWPEWLKSLIAIKLPKIITVIMVLLISYLLAILTWDTVVPLLWKKTPLVYIAPKIVNAQTTIKEKKDDYTFISELHMFGYIPVIKKEVIATPEVAPATRLKLSLHGVFIYSGAKDGAAIIGKAGKQQRYYKTGDEIQKGMELVEVRKDHVLLLRNGRFETLRFPELKKPKTKKSAENKSSDKSLASVVNVKEYRELFQKHPEKIAEHFNIIPVIRKGVLKGYRIKPQTNRSLYDELGLKTDDLLVMINGIPLNDRSQLSQVIAEISQAKMLTINLLRNKQQKTLLLDLR